MCTQHLNSITCPNAWILKGYGCGLLGFSTFFLRFIDMNLRCMNVDPQDFSLGILRVILRDIDMDLTFMNVIPQEYGLKFSGLWSWIFRVMDMVLQGYGCRFSGLWTWSL